MVSNCLVCGLDRGISIWCYLDPPAESAPSITSILVSELLSPASSCLQSFFVRIGVAVIVPGLCLKSLPCFWPDVFVLKFIFFAICAIIRSVSFCLCSMLAIFSCAALSSFLSLFNFCLLIWRVCLEFDRSDKEFSCVRSGEVFFLFGVGH